ncbi:hypothetical protein Hdeb2414_s0008g00286671 [Helianthus debilis subsp. tardiflorus]
MKFVLSFTISTTNCKANKINGHESIKCGDIKIVFRICLNRRLTMMSRGENES